MNTRQASHWPSAQLTKDFFSLGTLLYLQFFLVYGGTNCLAAQSQNHYQVFFNWELSSPFIALFIYPYLSLSLFVILPLFYIQPQQLRSWVLSYMWLTFAAGAVFIILPTELAITRTISPDNTALIQYLFSLLYAFDQPHNLFPSLHIAYTTLALLIIISRRRINIWLWLIISWWLLMLISVLLIQQHYLADIAAGLLLAIVCYYYCYAALIIKNK